MSLLRLLAGAQDRYIRFRDRNRLARCPHCDRRLAR